LRIGDSKIVVESVLVDPVDPLFNHRLVRHAAQVVIVVPVLSINHQGIAVPMGNGIAFPFQLFGMVLAVKTNNPGSVNHFVENHDVFFGLNNLHVVVVGAGNQ
jgi:hypothetical protein